MSRLPSRTDIRPPKTGKLTAAQKREIDKWRTDFRREIGRCEVCGHHPRNPWRDKPMHCSVLTVQEIQRGNGLRKKTLTYRGGVLCCCWWCNCHDLADNAEWPVPKQMAVLRYRRPEDYDIEAFARLIKPNAPNWITHSEVMAFADEVEGLLAESSKRERGW